MILQTGDAKTTAECDRIPLSRNEKIKRGFKAGSLFWVLALCCIPIPLLHFILVPVNVAIGTLKAWDFWVSDSILMNGKTKCPRCNANLTFTEQPAKWPLKILCDECAFQVRLFPQSASDASLPKT